MATRNISRLRITLLACGIAASGALMAQTVGTGTAQGRTSINSKAAHQDARAAEQDAAAARAAAEAAAAEQRSGSVTAEGAAQAEYSAWQADQASRRAERAAQAARQSANRTGAANAAAHGGTALPVETAIQSTQEAGNTRAAGEVARQAAMEAEEAAATARSATAAPPPPPPRSLPTDTRPSEPEVTITSSAPDSVVGDYRIDMAGMDTDGDGRLSRAEAASNATLTAEFAAVDLNGDGMLDAEELKGWKR